MRDEASAEIVVVGSINLDLSLTVAVVPSAGGQRTPRNGIMMRVPSGVVHSAASAVQRVSN